MEKSPTGTLLPQGYLPVGLVLPDTVVLSLLVEAKARPYNGVFNHVGGKDDNFRQQSCMSSRTMASPIQALSKALKVVVAMLHYGSEPGVFPFMRSMPEGSEQGPHQA
ncbi:hypothetical protein PInf_018532 [Phytophthora infestans]|nr:hypothetical protein PInf_018532 [Phytophthora infestans]